MPIDETTTPEPTSDMFDFAANLRFADYLQDVVTRFDRTFRHTFVSRAVERKTGVAASAFLGKTNRDLGMPMALVTQWERSIDGVFRTGQPDEIHFVFDGPAGQRQFTSFLVPEEDAFGHVVSVICLARDMTPAPVVDAPMAHSGFWAGHFRAIVESSDDAIISKTLNGIVTSWNRGAELIFGYSAAEMLGQPLLILFPADKIDEEQFILEKLLEGEKVNHFETVRIRKDGQRVDVSVTISPVRNSQGVIVGASKVARDITERKRQELAQNQANTVFTSSYEGIMVINAMRMITRINPSFTRITGYVHEDVVGRPPHVLASDRHNAEFYTGMWQSVHSKGYWSGEIWNRRKSGEIYAEHLSISAVPDASGEIQHYVGVFSDISKLKAHEDELDRVAHYDPLTGVPNRRLLADRLEQAILRANRSGKSLAVCYLDLDGFKGINDLYGHAAGDAVLIGVTEQLKHVLRMEDTLARLGGDEFVMLLSDITSPQECALILERALHAIGLPIQIDGLLVTVSASIGVSQYPDDHVDADTLLRHADQAMYQAKDAGKNRFHLFDPGNDRKVQMHRQSLLRLRNALTNHDFCLHYQPKVDLTTGALMGVEALIRWQDRQRGLVSPADFLPQIYGSTLEQPLGEWVILTALQQANAWMNQGMTIPVSVNVSAAHLMQPDFVGRLQSVLALFPALPAGMLELEILETAALGDIEQGIDVLTQCRALGIHFALDDFGTGYSSLTYLRKLPVDLLKIDQSFVRDMLRDADDLGIVEGVIRMATAFRRKVIAEGVETMAHGAALIALGCPLAQGYGIARPMPADGIPAWLDGWKRDEIWKLAHPAALPSLHENHRAAPLG